MKLHLEYVCNLDHKLSEAYFPYLFLLKCYYLSKF